MKTFHCDHCDGLVFFENVSCLQCGHALGFLPDILDLSALVPTERDQWKALAPSAAGRPYRSCANGKQHSICNWMIPAADGNPLCRSCRLTTVVPDLTPSGNLQRWHRLELAKRRLLCTLLTLGLPFESPNVPNARDSTAGSGNPLRFQFLGETDKTASVLTGHTNGLITVNIAEADDDIREKRRVSLHEPFRTLIGHFRHEIGHYYWDRLIAGSKRLQQFRDLFGDETLNYAQALKDYYQQGPPPDWAARGVSAYATAHPWEDWAETWAHYFHSIDTVETAASFGLTLRPNHPAKQSMQADPAKVAGASKQFAALITAWIPLTYALNSINRGVGLPDLYPFALSSAAIEKLKYVHDTIAECAQPSARQVF